MIYVLIMYLSFTYDFHFQFTHDSSLADRWEKFFPQPMAGAAPSNAMPIPPELSLLPLDFARLSQLLLSGSSASIVVDCTASDVIAAKYADWLHAGVHVVTPNKKAFSGDLGYWREIVKSTLKQPGVPYALCYHESTVGKVLNYVTLHLNFYILLIM